MTIRNEVRYFSTLGQLPDENSSEDALLVLQKALQDIKPPVSREEAELLISSFGSDDCYGLAWTLLHLIESAPGGPPLPSTRPSPESNEWLLRLWDRAHRGALYR
jgi:hypothetical protein